jgi:hypothetical protein
MNQTKLCPNVQWGGGEVKIAGLYIVFQTREPCAVTVGPPSDLAGGLNLNNLTSSSREITEMC